MPKSTTAAASADCAWAAPSGPATGSDLTRLALHVEHFGSGPRLLLAHGFAGSARNFRPQARLFAQRFSVTLYDARGHARSPAPLEPAEYAETELVADFAALVEAAGEPAFVGGLSLGAYTALRFALASPAAVRGLVLASFPSPGSDAKRKRWALGFADAIETQGLDRAGADFVWGERSRFDPKGAALIRQGFMEHTPHALAAILRQVLAELPAPHELAHELSNLRVPTLVLLGANDHESRAPSEELAKLIPNAEFITIPDAGHVLNLEQPDAFNTALSHFFAKH